MNKNYFTPEQRAKIIADWVLGIRTVFVWCEVYGDKPADSLHHLFEQNKITKRLYPEFIHHPDNILMVNLGNHLNRPIPHKDERWFCEHFKVEKRSKGAGGL